MITTLQCIFQMAAVILIINGVDVQDWPSKVLNLGFAAVLIIANLVLSDIRSADLIRKMATKQNPENSEDGVFTHYKPCSNKEVLAAMASMDKIIVDQVSLFPEAGNQKVLDAIAAAQKIVDAQNKRNG